MRSPEYPDFERDRDGFGAAIRVELHENTLHVPVHGSLADTEGAADLLRRLAARDVLKDLDLPLRKGNTHRSLCCASGRTNGS